MNTFKKKKNGRRKSIAREKLEATMTQAQRNEIEETFKLFDKDDSGHIDSSELIAVMASFGQVLNESEAKIMIDKYDTNGDKKIDFGEFLEMMASKIQDTESEKEIQKAFKVFDKDRDGFISLAELRYVMSKPPINEKLTDDELEQMMLFADLDSDGQINYDDFLQ